MTTYRHTRRSRRSGRTPVSPGQTSKGPSHKYNTWTPYDDGYILIREGTILKSYPKQLHSLGALKELSLWHFKSTSDNVARLNTLDKCSQYEAGFKLDGTSEGQFIYPTHDQLAQIYKGYNMTKSANILDNGAPYITDKRLKRYMREKRTRSTNSKKTRGKRKRKEKCDQTEKMSIEKERHKKAPVRIDDKISFQTPKNTINAMDKTGTLDKSCDRRNFPKYAKIQTIIKQIDSIFAMIGPAAPLTDKEREEDAIILAAAIKADMLKNSPSEDDDNGDGTDEDDVDEEDSVCEENEEELLEDEFDLMSDKLSSDSLKYLEKSYYDKHLIDDDDDSGLECVYNDLSITAVTTHDRSERQWKLMQMSKYITQPHYREQIIAKKQRLKKRNRDSEAVIEIIPEKDEEGDDDIDDCFASEDDDDSEKGEGDDDHNYSEVDIRIREALEKGGITPGMPSMWYQMYDQLGFDMAIETIQATDEYNLLRALL